jgi:hypothetical protein
MFRDTLKSHVAVDHQPASFALRATGDFFVAAAVANSAATAQRIVFRLVLIGCCSLFSYCAKTVEQFYQK